MLPWPIVVRYLDTVLRDGAVDLRAVDPWTRPHSLITGIRVSNDLKLPSAIRISELWPKATELHIGPSTILHGTINPQDLNRPHNPPTPRPRAKDLDSDFDRFISKGGKAPAHEWAKQGS